MLQLDQDTSVVVKRGMRRGVATLLREREWGAALGSLIGVFLLVQILLIILMGAQGMQSLLKNRTDVRLEVRAEAQGQDVHDFFAVLRQEPYVADAAYITREQAYERARTHDPELIAFLEEFGMGNPFPDTIGVTLQTLDDYPRFRRFVEQNRWSPVIDPSFLSEVTDQEKQIEELLRFTEAGRSVTGIILALVATVLLFITTELVRRRVLLRANELLVEKLVGASPLAMFVPFATEACILLLLAIGLSILASAMLMLSFPSLVPALRTGGVLSAFSTEVVPIISSTLPAYYLLELLAVPAIAAFGTWLGMRDELRSRILSLHNT